MEVQPHHPNPRHAAAKGELQSIATVLVGLGLVPAGLGALAAFQDAWDQGSAPRRAETTRTLTAAYFWRPSPLQMGGRSKPERSVRNEPRGKKPVEKSAVVRPALDRLQKAAVIDAARTSWEDPFDPACWEGSGWHFSLTAMRAAGNRRAQACFLRPYRCMLLEGNLLANVADAQFAVQLTAPETRSTVTISFAGNEIIVTDDSSPRSRVMRRKELLPGLAAGTSSRFRIAATGNRLAISWGGRIVVTCDQPAAQSGHDLVCSLLAAHGGCEVSKLRIEGD